MTRPPKDSATDSTTPLVGRLAPSPTGVLHLGNVRSFLIAWLSIRSRGGRILLRIEDLDGPRVRPELIDQTIEGLLWLGFDWDGDAVIQSTRSALHEAAAERLLNSGLAYPCICSRREIEESASAPHEATLDGPTYPGTCYGRFSSVEEARAKTGRDPALRFRVQQGSVPFDDRFLGRQPGPICGDFVICKRDGGAAYQLAVVVDDADQGVTEVLRADDLLPSTPRQLLLYRELGWTPPQFVHIPLVVGNDGRRLAKRHGDTSIDHFRRRGVSPERLVGRVAELAGLVGPDHLCRPEELVAAFDLASIPTGAVVGEEHGLFDAEAD